MSDTANPFSQATSQVSQFIRELTLRQKAMLAGATGLVALTLFFFVRMMAAPEMKPLVSGMEPQDAQALSAKLSARNIRYTLSADGKSVSVPADQLDQARLETASEGMPRSGRMGFELFDKPNWAGSDFSEKVTYQRALEGELERTIQTMRGVEAVRVHLVLPQDSVFVDREGSAKASVVLRLHGAGLNTEEHTAVANLVAGAVEKLKPENVSVVDADTNRPMNNLDQGDSPSSGKYEEQLASRLVKDLEAVVGPNHARVTVHLDRDLTSGEETQETYDPNSTVALTMQKTEERSGATLAGGIPGTASNVPNGSGSALPKPNLDEGAQSSKSENGTYAVNRLVRHTVLPAGRVRKLSAAILVDDVLDTKTESGKPAETRRKRTPEELKQIEDLARASLGIDASRGDSLTVQNLSFQSERVEAPQPPSATQRVQLVIQQWSSLLRYLAIFLLFAAVYAVLLRPVKRQLLLSFKETSQRSRLKPSTKEVLVGQNHNTIEGEASTTESIRLKKQAIEKVKAEPAATSRLLQSWIREGGAQ
jgi:flagellar M-ring protein FliF